MGHPADQAFCFCFHADARQALGAFAGVGLVLVWAAGRSVWNKAVIGILEAMSSTHILYSFLIHMPGTVNFISYSELYGRYGKYNNTDKQRIA